MASADATFYPTYNQARLVTGVFILSTTLRESSGSLTALAASVSKDGGAYVTCTNSPVQQGTTGIVSVLLTATEMTANTVVVKFTSSLANAADVIQVFYPAVLTEPTGRADSQTVVRLESYIVQTFGKWFNKRVQSNSSGAYTLYKNDSSTTMVSGSVDGSNSDQVTVGKVT